MKFGQLVEYNTRNFILEKSYTKCGAESSPRHLSGKLTWSMSLDQWSRVSYSLFSLYPKFRAIEKTKLQTACFHLNIKHF